MVTTTASSLSFVYEPQTWMWRGHRIRYVVQGSGQPLLLLHGFGASIRHWRKNIPALAAAGYRVFALDLLGFGASDKPPQADYSIDLWEALVVDFWAEQIQQPTVFVGNSIGALLGLTVVARHPELAAAGILINCAGGLNHRPNELNGVFRLLMGGFTTLVRSPLGGFLFDRVRRPERIRATLKQVYRDPAAITDELVNILYEPSCDAGAAQVFAAVLTAPAGSPPEDLLPQVRCPLLVVWGEADPWTPIQRGLGFERYVTTPYQFAPLPNTGHCPHDERPTEVNALILDWLAKLAPSS